MRPNVIAGLLGQAIVDAWPDPLPLDVRVDGEGVGNDAAYFLLFKLVSEEGVLFLRTTIPTTAITPPIDVSDEQLAEFLQVNESVIQEHAFRLLTQMRNIHLRRIAADLEDDESYTLRLIGIDGSGDVGDMAGVPINTLEDWDLYPWNTTLQSLRHLLLLELIHLNPTGTEVRLTNDGYAVIGILFEGIPPSPFSGIASG